MEEVSVCKGCQEVADIVNNLEQYCENCDALDWLSDNNTPDWS